MTDNSTLEIGEIHPMAHLAYEYIIQFIKREPKTIEALASCENRTAEICSETLDRILNNGLVSDRYILGLAWFLQATKTPKHKANKIGGSGLMKEIFSILLKPRVFCDYLCTISVLISVFIIFNGVFNMVGIAVEVVMLTIQSMCLCLIAGYHKRVTEEWKGLGLQ